MTVVACLGCDSIRHYYREYKQSQLVEIAYFPYDGADDTTIDALHDKLKRNGVDVTVETNLGICTVSVDRGSATTARVLIEQDSDLSKRGVALFKD